MGNRAGFELEKAKEHFQALRLQDAYTLFRRFYDRLPFRHQPEHAEYMGMFIRVLYELGRENELFFYRKELEKLFHQYRSAELGYQLAMTYLTENRSDLIHAKDLLEELIPQAQTEWLSCRIKMALANCYDILDGDVAACTLIIDSLKEPADPYLRDLYWIWKAKNLRDRERLDDAESILQRVLARVNPSYNWYAYFSAKIIQGGIYLQRGDFESLVNLVTEVRGYCEKNPLRTIRRQIESLADAIRGQVPNQELSYVQKGSVMALTYNGKSISLNGKVPWEKLLLLLMHKKVAPKEKIIEHLYERPYAGASDDKLIYSHIHSVKKCLKRLGIPGEPISRDRSG